MDPQQQQNPNPEPQPQQTGYGQSDYASTGMPVTSTPGAASPQVPASYASPSTEYDPNYLDSIAPPPAQAKFLSGTFGKIFWVLIAMFVLGVSIIIASSGKDSTADLQQLAVRLDNLSRVTKTAHTNLKSKNLSKIDADFKGWITDNTNEAEDLLKKGGVNKTQYSKEMVKNEKKIATDLDAKFEEARLGAILNRVYASTMAAETEKLINMLNSMAKKNKSSQIRTFAKEASSNLSPIQKEFEDYNDNGN